MTDNIKLPRLPEPDEKTKKGFAFSGFAMESYAREAVRLNAAPEPQGVPARMSCRKCGKPHPNPDCKYITPSDIEQESQMQHPDDAAVDAFAAAMKEKLAKARAKGRGGWQTCPPETLSRMLHEHVEKGDPLDVANFCMFLWSLGYGIEPNSELMKTAMQWAERAGYAERALAAHPQQSGAEQERKPLSEAQVIEMCGDANRGFCIEFDEYLKAVRDTEAAHGITKESP